MQNCISSLLEGIWPRVREGPSEEEAVAPAGRRSLVRRRRWCPGPTRAKKEVEEVREGGGVESVRCLSCPTSGGDGCG
jgi:hypothetical protein